MPKNESLWLGPLSSCRHLGNLITSSYRPAQQKKKPRVHTSRDATHTQQRKAAFSSPAHCSNVLSKDALRLSRWAFYPSSLPPHSSTMISINTSLHPLDVFFTGSEGMLIYQRSSNLLQTSTVILPVTLNK